VNIDSQTDEFHHVQTAHCENGVTTALLRYHGLDFMTEPLAFGMGSGLKMERGQNQLWTKGGLLFTPPFQ